MNPILSECVETVQNLLGDKYTELYVEKAVLGLFFSGVKINTSQGGMCFTPIKMIPEAVCCPSSAKLMPSPGKLKGRKVSEYIKDIDSSSILKKTLGIATLNALSSLCYEMGLIELNLEQKFDAFDIPQLTNINKAVVVGALVPIIKRLKNENIDYTILEKDNRTLKGSEIEHFAPAENYKTVIPNADIIFITGTTLINDTLEDLLHYAKKDAQIVVAGPTVSLITEPFRKRGVSILGADYVKNSDEMLEILSEGGSGYHLFGKSIDRISIIL